MAVMMAGSGVGSMIEFSCPDTLEMQHFLWVASILKAKREFSCYISPKQNHSQRRISFQVLNMIRHSWVFIYLFF